MELQTIFWIKIILANNKKIYKELNKDFKSFF